MARPQTVVQFRENKPVPSGYGVHLPCEAPLFEMRPALRSMLPALTPLVVLLLCSWLLPLMLKLLLLLPLLAGFVEIGRRRLNAVYSFYGSHLKASQGRLGTVLRSRRIDYCDVREIRICQSILGRIFGYGKVCLDTDANDRSQVAIAGVADPLRVACLVDKLRDEVCGQEQRCRYRLRGQVLEQLPSRKISPALLHARLRLGAGKK